MTPEQVAQLIDVLLGIRSNLSALVFVVGCHAIVTALKERAK
jgi:hypothetical protein